MSHPVTSPGWHCHSYSIIEFASKVLFLEAPFRDGGDVAEVTVTGEEANRGQAEAMAIFPFIRSLPAFAPAFPARARCGTGRGAPTKSQFFVPSWSEGLVT